MIIKTSYVASIIAAILAVYRLVALLFFTDSTDIVRVMGHLSIMGFFVTLSAYLYVYADYREHLIHKSTRKILIELQLMKALSLITGLCCILRIFSTFAYFSQMESINTVTLIYVIVEISLWAVLAVFFFLVWKKMSTRIEKTMDQL